MSSSDKSRALKVWSESVAKNMEMFQEGAEMMVRDHQKSNVKHSSFAIHLQHMSARESSLPIKASLETLSQRIDHSESERLKVLAQMQALMVNKFTKYPGELKVLNTSISKRNTQVSEFARAERDFASARASGDSRKIDIASGHLKVAEEHMRSAEDVLNKRLGDFELMRVSEMKELLKRYIRNEIFFHAKSIEGLTQANQEVVKIEPETEKAVFLRRIRETEYQDKRAAGNNAPAGQPLQSPTQQLLQPQQSQYQLQHQSSQQHIPTQSPQFSPQNSQTGAPLQSPQAR